MNTKRFSRRNALKLMGAATGSGALAVALAACGSATQAPQATTAAGATAAPASTEAPAAPAAGSAAEKWAKLTAKNPKQDWTPTYPAFKPYDPVVEIICTADGGVKWKEGENQTNNPYTWMREALQGIKYTPKWEAYSDVALTKLKADIAANDPPELFCTSGSDMAQYVQTAWLKTSRKYGKRLRQHWSKRRNSTPRRQLDSCALWRQDLRYRFLYGPATTSITSATSARTGWIRSV